MIKSTLRKLKTLYRLTAEYKDIGSLVTSLYEYLKLRSSLNKQQYVKSGKRIFIYRLPNGLRAIVLANPKYLRAYVATYDEIFVMNIYERLRDFIPNEHDVVLDLGTFIGLYTLKHYKAEHIFAFEPHPISYTLLCSNIRLNELENVKYLNYAIWSQSGYLPFYEEDFLVSSSTLISEWHKNTHIKSFMVRTVSFDQLIEQRIIPAYIDIAKVDIEGAEMEFIKGGEKTLSRGHINRMVIEVHKKVVNLKDFYSKLKELGFRFNYRISGYETDIVYVIHVR
jgi:FkbM family methyltransferase